MILAIEKIRRVIECGVCRLGEYRAGYAEGFEAGRMSGYADGFAKGSRHGREMAAKRACTAARGTKDFEIPRFMDRRKKGSTYNVWQR